MTKYRDAYADGFKEAKLECRVEKEGLLKDLKTLEGMYQKELSSNAKLFLENNALKVKCQRNAIGFFKWYEKQSANVFEETDTIEDAYDIYLTTKLK